VAAGKVHQAKYFCILSIPKDVYNDLALQWVAQEFGKFGGDKGPHVMQFLATDLHI